MANASLMTRLRAKAAGEIPAATLEAYRAAGAGAYDLFVAAEQRRAADPGAAAGTFFLGTWNAFALQTLGDAFVEADYEADPNTVGFVPPVTAEQALAFYAEVEQWLVRARQAEHDGGRELDADVPAELPGWAEVEPCPDPHLHAMMAACKKVADHAAIAVGDLERRPDVDAKVVATLRGELTAVSTAADYAQQLHTQYHRSRRDRALHERIEQSVKDAIERGYRLGQLAAMPELVERSAGAALRSPKRLPLPGEPGFDPWCLTDPRTRSQWQADPAARRAIDVLWRSDPSPERTLRIQGEIDAALERGDIDYAVGPDGRRLGNYYCCPWAPIYEAKRRVRIAGLRLEPKQQFTFDVSAEEIFAGGTFTRELMLGDFRPTNEVDYCDPTAGGR